MRCEIGDKKLSKRFRMICAAPHDHITHTHTPLRGRTRLCHQGQGLVDSMTHPPDQLVYLPPKLQGPGRWKDRETSSQPVHLVSLQASGAQLRVTYSPPQGHLDLPIDTGTNWRLSLHPMSRGQRCCYMSDKAQDGPLNTAELRLMTLPEQTTL